MKKLLIIVLILLSYSFSIMKKFPDFTERWYQGYDNYLEGMTNEPTNNYFGINDITPEVELDVNGEIQAVTVDCTYLQADNLKANLDAGDYDITNIDDLDADQVTASVSFYTPLINILSATVTTATITYLGGNLDVQGYAITDIGNLEADYITASATLYTPLATITNLYATNLEKDLDGAGYDIAIEDIAAGGTVTADTKLYSALIEGVNLKATNLEADLDATGYDISAIADINASGTITANFIDCTNLKATNLERDLDGTGYTITANRFSDGTASITGGVASGFTSITSTTFIGNLTGTATTASYADNADTLDLQHGAYYQDASNLNAGTLPDARLTGEYTVSTLNTDVLVAAVARITKQYPNLDQGYAATWTSGLTRSKEFTLDTPADASATSPFIFNTESGNSISFRVGSAQYYTADYLGINLFNNGSADIDFVINKSGGGQAYTYDAGDATHTFNGAVNITTASITNLEADLDGTGYDLIIQDINAGGSVTANLFTDGTATITGGVGSGFTNFTSVTINATEANITNLYATNLEADLDGTGYDLIIQDINAGGSVTANLFTDGTAIITGGVATGFTSITSTTFIGDLTGTATTASYSDNADTLDLQHGAYYQDASNLNAGTVPDARLTGEYTITTLNVTDLLATNLESDIDGTSFQATLNALTVDHLRLSNSSVENSDGIFNLTNLVSDQDTILNVSDGGVNTQLMILDGSKARVGIGPGFQDIDARLHVEEDFASFPNKVFIAEESTTVGTSNVAIVATFLNDSTQAVTDGFGSAIEFAINENNDDETILAQIQATRTGADNEGTLEFLAGTDGAEPFMAIKPDGDVTINNNLNVAGTVTANDIIVNDNLSVAGTVTANNIIVNERLGVGTATPTAPIEVEDGGTTAGMVVKITQDDENVKGLIIGNDTYSTTDTDGMSLQLQDDGDGIINVAGDKSLRLQIAADPKTIINENGMKHSNSRATISGGTITLDTSYVDVETQGGAASDNLDTITAPVDGGGQLVHLRAENGSHTVVVRDAGVSGGNIQLNANVSCSMADTRDTLFLIYHHNANAWCEVSRSNN